MSAATPAIRDLARRLVALEASGAPPGSPGDGMRACEKLRVPLAKFMGEAGFRSLLARALALAAAEVPWLGAMRVRGDGTVEELAEVSGREGPAQAGEAEAAVVAQLIGLLVAFIGEPLTLRLVRDAWPGAPVGEMDAGDGGGHERG